MQSWALRGALSALIAVLFSTTLAAAPMSFSNRMLLNRAVANGQQQLQVMVLTDPKAFARVKNAVATAGGQVRKEISAIHYLRADLPISALKVFIERPDVMSYQIATGANMIWTQEGRTEAIATMYRGYEIRPPGGEAPPTEVVREVQKKYADLPALTPQQSLATGYTAEDDTGVTKWNSQHPTWDGRGVTVAMLESGLPQFDHPTLRSAKDVKGQPVPKLAGFVNTVDAESGDDTRVSMTTVIRNTSSWYAVNNRNYVLPRLGEFRFGVFSPRVGGNLRQDFAVLWDPKSGEFWVDGDGDANFANEKVLRDVNESIEVGQLKFTQPSKYEMAYVVAKANEPDVVHVYMSKGGHQAMTASVAAGSRTSDGVASGVAPNARLLFVRNQDSGGQAYDFVEGYAEIASRPDVDVLSDSRGVTPMPDMSGEFYSVAFQRIAEAYGKPIFHSGGNGLAGMGRVSSLEGVFSVGGSMSPATYAALFGGGTLPGQIKHPLMSEGPGGDGGFKPDFIAPMHRISADKCADGERTFMPRNAPTLQLPPCYSISCCTSASGPYAAGVAALLISAARQNKQPVELDDLGRAMRASATFLQDSPAYAQGAGLLDINAAWKEMNRKVSLPQIKVSGPVVRPMANYSQTGEKGAGLFEFSGWAPGQSGERHLTFTRESGASSRIKYRISWTGNSGTFESPTSLTLNLNQPTLLPINILPKSYGAHSAIVNLHDPATGAIVLRSLATVVAAQPVPQGVDTSLSFEEKVPLMRSKSHFISVPAGSPALRVDLEVKHGALTSNMLSMDPSESVPNRPSSPRGPFLVGKHSWVVPNPAAGTWTLSLTNETGRSEKDPAKVSTEEASYTLSFSVLDGSITADASSGRLSIEAQNHGPKIGAPVADVYPATLVQQTASFSTEGTPNLIPIDVAEGSGLLQLRAKSNADANELEMFLYDCTSGQCFFWDYSGSAASEHMLTVRKPKAGKWMVAVNAAPTFGATGGFVLEKIVGGAAVRHALDANLRLPAVDVPPIADSEGQKVLYCELVDAQLQDAESKRRAITAAEDTPVELKNAAKPIAIATTLYRVK